MAKKPATLSDDLLQHRPRKGKAKAQSEEKAGSQVATEVANQIPTREATTNKPRKRRGGRSQNTAQLNMKLRPEVADRFSELADKEDLIFGDMLEKLLDSYQQG